MVMEMLVPWLRCPVCVCVPQTVSGGSGSGTAPPAGGGASASTADATGPADTHSASPSQSYPTTPEHGSTGSITSPPPGVLNAAGQPQPAAVPQEAGAPGLLRTSYDSAAATEREAEQALLRSELGDLVTRDPRVGLSELESKLELIRPEDLAIMRFLGSGGYGEVRETALHTGVSSCNILFAVQGRLCAASLVWLRYQRMPTK